MTMQTMAQVAAAVRHSRYSADTDLPLPNIYWCSVDMPDFGTFHTHLASDHTKAAVHKMANWCVENKGFRPYRSNSQLKVRRLKLGDLIENPAAHALALKNAVAAGERDMIDALEKLPAWILAHCGAARVVREAVTVAANHDVWERLTLEISGLGLVA